MKIRPLHDMLLIKVEKPDSVTKSGIILTTEEDAKLERATVLEAGPDAGSVKKGDTIVYKSFALDTVEIEGEQLYFLKEENVLGIEQ